MMCKCKKLTTPLNKLTLLTSAILFCIVACLQPLHIVKFDSNGGIVIQDQAVVDGECVTIPSNPTRGGYIFDGWFSDSNLTLEYNFNTPVKANLTLYAKWNPELPASESGSYILFTSDNPFSVGVKNKGWDGIIQYSFDGINWLPDLKTSSKGWDGTTINSSVNYKLYFRGTGNSVITGFPIVRVTYCDYGWVINGTKVSIQGNIMALLNYSDPEKTRMGNCCFEGMFSDCSALTSISPTLLPATNLANRCYCGMFSGCTGLTTVPMTLLPALSLTESCYSGMFARCTSITSLPSELLPATNLAKNCYSSMFSDCTSLTSVPISFLPATNLAFCCYTYMFMDCLTLMQAPQLPAASLDSHCYESMFENCKALKITDIASDITVQIFNCPSNSSHGVYEMFEGCDLQNNCPATPTGATPGGTPYYFIHP